MIRNSCIFAAFILLCPGCHNAASYLDITGYAQGGTYRITYLPAEDAAERPCPGSEELKRGVDSILAVIDTALSGYNTESLVSRYNRGEIIEDDGSAEYRVFGRMMHYCDSIYTATEGVVDCRAAALYDVWGFGFKEGRLPSPEQVRQAMEDRSKINFNAVAQGFSADQLAAYLRSFGIKDMLVDVGGEFLCSGFNPKGKCWTIGIDAPVDGNMTPGENMAECFTLKDTVPKGVVTSGNYRKFYIEDGVKYSHTIDPRSGRPVRHNLLSATLIAPTSALADALATYCMVIGPQKAREFIESRDDLEGCLISGSGIWTSEGFNAGP